MLQILDERGHLVGPVPEGLDEGVLTSMMRLMLLGREIDGKAVSLQRRGKLGTYAPLSGQEACSVGSAFAVVPGVDYLVPQYREQLAMLRFGLPLGIYLLQRYGHPLGAQLPDHGTLFPQQVALGSHLPHATGLAWGLRLRGVSAVVLCHFGDGASSQGDFHEALNLAGVKKAPVIFFCQNNQWAISVPTREQTAATAIADRATGLGVFGQRVDGNDILAVYEATRVAKARALAGDGPTLIEGVTYRLGAHTTADDPTLYIDAAELDEARSRDPISRFRTWLTAEGLWDETLEAKAEEEIERVIEDAIEVFDAAGEADPTAMFAHVYAEDSQRLIRQREEFEASLGEA